MKVIFAIVWDVIMIIYYFVIRVLLLPWNRVSVLFRVKCRDCRHNDHGMCFKIKGIVHGSNDICGYFLEKK